MRNNYDNVARYYDVLSRMVFHTAQHDAQTALLPFIRENSRVLIAGGGTGWILEEMAKICPSGLHIHYVEISANMIAIAKQKKYQPHEVTFINMAVEEFGIELTDAFDVIITPFLFDNFSQARIRPVFLHLDSMLRPGGQWLFTDFYYQQQAPFWQRILLGSMYTFFRILCRVEASALADVGPLFGGHHYNCLHEAFYFRKFIRTAVYGKSGVVNNC
jgi:ubiquinone/menaquinone biosynthesis C-methylase UbiE